MPNTNRLLPGQFLISQAKETTHASLRDDPPRPTDSYLISPNKKFLLTMQKDGNLVIYGTNSAIPDSLILPADFFVVWASDSAETMEQRAIPGIAGRYFVTEEIKTLPRIVLGLNTNGYVFIKRNTFSVDITKTKTSTKKVGSTYNPATNSFIPKYETKTETYKEPYTLPEKTLWEIRGTWESGLAKNPELILQNSGELELFVSGKKVWGSATGFLPANFPVGAITSVSTTPTTATTATAAQEAIQQQQAIIAAQQAAAQQAAAQQMQGGFLDNINPIFIIAGIGLLFIATQKK